MDERQKIDESMEIDLIELFFVLLKKWWLIGLVGIICAMLTLGYTVMMVEPLYQSKTTVYVLNKTTSLTSIADLQLGSELTDDFKIIALSNSVIDGAIEKLQEEDGKTFTRKELKEMVTVSNVSDSRVLEFTATSTDPIDACLVANAVREVMQTRMAEIMKSDSPSRVDAAEVAMKPISPNLGKNTVVGFLAGVVAVCVVLVIRYLLNDAIRTEEDVKQYLGVPVLVVVPNINNKEMKKEELKMQKKELKERAE